MNAVAQVGATVAVASLFLRHFPRRVAVLREQFVRGVRDGEGFVCFACHVSVSLPFSITTV